MPSRRTEPGPGARRAGAIGSGWERDPGPLPLGPGAGRAIDVWSGPACTTSCAAADRPGLPAREGGGQTDGAVPAFLHVVDLGGVHRAAGDPGAVLAHRPRTSGAPVTIGRAHD